MKENSSTRLKHSIQKKLMAATSMLMVAIIMMVSSTYAWFTLSTAPEVTGITTAVGANGNLEIALATADTWADAAKVSSAVGTSGDNTAWGNLIDVSDTTTYGLDKIVLLPAQLNETEGVVAASYLSTPVYGSDGRVSSLESSTYTGVYNNASGSFAVDSEMGVRAVGTASAMTQRQTDYRNARSAMSTNGTLAQKTASSSLYNYGSSLGNIIVAHATNNDKYDSDDVQVIKDVIATLKTSLTYVETALEKAIMGYVASGTVQNMIDDTAYEAVRNFLTLNNVSAGTDDGTYVITVNQYSYPLPADWCNAYTIYLNSKANLDEAEKSANAIDTNTDINWDTISNPLRHIVDPNNSRVNGHTMEEVQEDKNLIVSAVIGGEGLRVELPTGSGIYADIAALAGDYSTSITLTDVSYGSLDLDEKAKISATMTTTAIGPKEGQIETPYFTSITSKIVEFKSPSAGNTESGAQLTDIYGYAIDMLFRTNAANSNLLLQTNAVDRIYEGNTANEETMGGGSTMTFATSNTNAFTADQVAELMKAIRVVFMDETGEILAKAKLKVDATDTLYYKDGESVTAGLYVYDEAATDTTTYTETITENTITEVTDTTSYKDKTETDSDTGIITEKAYTITQDDGAATYTVVEKITVKKPVVSTQTTSTFLTGDDAVITALSQNIPERVTVLVYLDGNLVDNSMVAASVEQSMTGTMNLQFASDATLVPMEYTALYEAGASISESEETTVTDESGSVTP